MYKRIPDKTSYLHMQFFGTLDFIRQYPELLNTICLTTAIMQSVLFRITCIFEIMLYTGCCFEITKRLKFYNQTFSKEIKSGMGQFDRSSVMMRKLQQSYFQFMEAVRHM